MDLTGKKKSLRSGLKNRVGRVSRNTQFFRPYCYELLQVIKVTLDLFDMSIQVQIKYKKTAENSLED